MPTLDLTTTPSTLLLQLSKAYNAIESPMLTIAPPSDTAKVTVLLTILAVSLVSVSFPAISSSGIIQIPDLLFFVGKHLGTGVILATAFIHLLPDSFDALLSNAVKERYGNIGKWTGFIILSSLLAIFLVEYVSTTYVDRLHSKPSAPSSPLASRATLPLDDATETTTAVILPFLANSPKIMRFRSRTCLICPNDVCVCIPAPVPEEGIVREHDAHHHHHHHHHHSHEEKHRIGRRRQIVGIFVLQLGIMIHSLVIGLTLSVTSGADFASLTTAVIFHQLFEGLSLGIRIAALPQARLSAEHHPDDEEEQRQQAGSPKLLAGDLTNNKHPTPLAITEPADPQAAIPVLRLDDDSGEAASSSTPLLQKSRGPKRQTTPNRPRLTLEWRGWQSLRHIFQEQPEQPPQASYNAVGSSTSSFSTQHVHDHEHEHHHAHGIRWLLAQLSLLKTTLSFLFGITTPVGMVIGMFVLKSQDHGDKAPLKFFQGVMSAVSAGMLIYAATVEMIAGDFVFGDVEGGHHHHHHHAQHPEGKEQEQPQASLAKKALAILSLLVGVLTMVVIGLGE